MPGPPKDLEFEGDVIVRKDATVCEDLLVKGRIEGDYPHSHPHGHPHTHDHGELTSTHNLTTDIDHNQLANFETGKHRIHNDDTTSPIELWSSKRILIEIERVDNPGKEDPEVDHSLLLNTHNLTTDIDHSLISNAHNLSTDINHDLITNTHNLTTNISHDQIADFVSDEHVNHRPGLSGDYTVGEYRFELFKGLITKIRKYFPLSVPEIKKYKILVSLDDDRRLWNIVKPEDTAIGVGQKDYTRFGLFRWKINLPSGYKILDATVAYYVITSQDGVPNSEYWTLDSTNIGPYQTGDPASQYSDVRHGDKKFSGSYPSVFPSWKKRNITSWIKWYYNHPYYAPGKYFGIKFGPGSGISYDKHYQIRDKYAGDGNEAYIWIKYETNV